VISAYSALKFKKSLIRYPAAAGYCPVSETPAGHRTAIATPGYPQRREFNEI
jgi:hypothetical protein